MKDWQHIKEQIRKAEEPLSHKAWEEMEAMLATARPKRRWGLLGLLALVLLLLVLTVLPSAFDPQLSKPEPKPVLPLVNEGDKGPIDQLEPETSAATHFSGKAQSDTAPVSGLTDSGNGAGHREKPTDPYAAIVSSTESKKSDTLSNNSVVVLKAKEARLPLSDSLLSAVVVYGHEWESLPLLEPKAEKRSRLEMRFYLTSSYNIPHISYRPQAAQTHKSYLEAAQNSVQAGLGFDAGFELRYKLGRYLRLSSGIGYREIVTQNSFDYQINEIPVIDSASGEIVAYLPSSNPRQVSNTSSNIYTFLNIPLSLYWEKPLAPRWKLTTEAIHQFSVLLNQSGYQINPQSLEAEASQADIFKRVVYSYQLRLGVRYQVNRNMALALEPAYRRAYTDFFTSDDISWKPEDFSLSLSAIVQILNP